MVQESGMEGVGGGVSIAPSAINNGKKLCFVMIMFCSAGESTVTDNKFCTI